MTIQAGLNSRADIQIGDDSESLEVRADAAVGAMVTSSTKQTACLQESHHDFSARLFHGLSSFFPSVTVMRLPALTRNLQFSGITSWQSRRRHKTY